MIETANIHQAIVATMADVGYVQKESSRGLNYSYASEAALIQALRPVMVEHGIFCYVLSYTPEREKYETTKGTAMTATVASGVVRFVHAPTGTYIDVMALGEGADAGDKSANKAMTGLLKYALRQTFLIETGDDPDRERPEAVHGEQKADIAPQPNGNERPYSPLALRDTLQRTAYAMKQAIEEQKQWAVELVADIEKYRGVVAGNIEKAFAGDAKSAEKRHSFLAFVWGDDVTSAKDLTEAQVLAHRKHLNWSQDSGGEWVIDELAAKEIRAAVQQRMEEQHAGSLFPEAADG
jgi:hypothetical protein